MLRVFISYKQILQKFLTLTVVFCLSIIGSLVAQAAEQETDFLSQLEGHWTGSGRVLAGPDQGTDFKCALKGKPSRTGVRISMDGKCSIGRLSARMDASIKYSGGVRKYIGQFLGGAEGDGLDIYGDRRGNALKLRLSRGRLKGNMDLLLQRKDLIRVIISVTDTKRNRDIPVIALDLNKIKRSAALEE